MGRIGLERRAQNLFRYRPHALRRLPAVEPLALPHRRIEEHRRVPSTMNRTGDRPFTKTEPSLDSIQHLPSRSRQHRTLTDFTIIHDYLNQNSSTACGAKIWIRNAFSPMSWEYGSKSARQNVWRTSNDSHSTNNLHDRISRSVTSAIAYEKLSRTSKYVGKLVKVAIYILTHVFIQNSIEILST
jgi:hypothetical protein